MRGKRKNSTPPSKMAPSDTLNTASASARANRRSRACCATENGGAMAPRPARRSSMLTKVDTAKIRYKKKNNKKVVSTVSTAAASTAANESMARNNASRSVVALYSRTTITNSRKCTTATNAANSGGFEELATKARENSTMSTGKKNR